MKTRILLTILSAFFYLQINAQPNWQWLKNEGGAGAEAAFCVSSFYDGSVYMAGVYKSTGISFGAFNLTNSSPSYDDVFVVKYDANGNVLWAVSGNGNEFDKISSITTDASGNVYITGYFASTTLTFGSLVLNNPYPTIPDMFIVKLDANGVEQWGKSAGGGGNEFGNAIITDPLGNVYVAGTFTSNNVSFGAYAITLNANIDYFLVKYDNSGNEQWAKSGGGSGNDEVHGLAVASNGDAYVAGGYDSPSMTIGGTTLTNANAGLLDMFIAKYDANGAPQWAKGIGGTGTDLAKSLAMNYLTGYILLCGSYDSPGFNFASQTIPNATGFDLFAAQFDPGGGESLIIANGSLTDDFANSIVSDYSGNVYLTGTWRGPNITFGSNTLYANVADPLSQDMTFLVKMSPAGFNGWWAKNIGSGDNYVTAMNMTSPASGEVVIAGEFSDTAFYDNSFLKTIGSSDIFIGKIAAYTVVVNIYETDGITLIDSGTVYLFEYNTNDTAMRKVDSTASSSGGNFYFNNVLPGNYLVLAIADSAMYPFAVPTYSGDTAFWKNASPLQVNYDSAQATIKIIEIDTSKLTGQATIKGKLLEGTYSGKIMAKGDGITSINTSVVDRTSNSIINISKTDTGGNFIFSDLQLGNYFVYVNIPGIPMDTNTYKVDITTSDTTVSLIGTADTNLIWFVVDTTNTSIGKLPIERENNLQIYPNPFNNHTQMIYELKENSEVKIEVYDVLGRKLKTLIDTKQKEGTYKYQLSLSQSGVYILKMKLDEKVFTKKLVKIK